jgi:hypothetical protein
MRISLLSPYPMRMSPPVPNENGKELGTARLEDGKGVLSENVGRVCMVTMIKGEVETMRMWVSMFTMIKGKVETMRMWGGYDYHDKGRGGNHENVGEYVFHDKRKGGNHENVGRIWLP